MVGESNPVEQVVARFLAAEINGEQLSDNLRRLADAEPRAFEIARINWDRIPELQLFEIMRIMCTITRPVLTGFFSGGIDSKEAARQVAPYLLMWAGFGIGFGIELAHHPTPEWDARRDELEREIVMIISPPTG